MTRPDEQTLTMLGAINHTLHAEMERDERVLVFGENVGVGGGAFGASEGLLAAFGGQRVIDLPAAQSAMLGAAAGLAAGGMIPVPELSWPGFSHHAMHQLAGQIARFRYRTRGRFPMGITIRAPFGAGAGTPELHAGSVEAQLSTIAGLKVVAPASAADAKGLLTEAIRDPDPVLFLEPVRGYHAIAGPVPIGEHRVPFGQARWVVGGDDVTIITWSYQVQVATRVARRMATRGVNVGVLDLRTLVPLDIEGIVAAVGRTGRVVVVEEAAPTAGFGAEIIATINEEAFYSLEVPPIRVSGFDTPYPVALLEASYVPDGRRIEAAVLRVLEA